MSADLRIFLTAADEAFPVTGSVVTILAADGRELYSEIVSTESEGRSGPFKLFAPSIPSDEPDEPGPKPYSKYTVLIKAKGIITSVLRVYKCSTALTQLCPFG